MDSTITSSLSKSAFPAADRRKTTSLLKTHLKEKYGIKASIKSHKSSLQIEYDFGTDANALASDLKCLEFGDKPSSQIGFVLDGYQLETFSHVFVTQTIPVEFWYELARFFNSKVRYAELPDVTTQRAFVESSFDTLFCRCWTWYQLIQRLFSTRHFCTQDPSKIVFLDIASSESWDYELLYECDGNSYSTKRIHPTAAAGVVRATTRPNSNGAGIVVVDELKSV